MMTAMRTLRKRIKRSPSGLACVFVAIDDKRGIKFFRDKCDRDDNRDRQKLIFEKTGLACEVFDDFDAAGYYGFITERATPIKDGPTILDKKRSRYDSRLREEIWEGLDNISDYDSEFIDRDDADEWELEKLDLNAEKKEVVNTIGAATGIWLRDMHTGNMGYNLKGQLIPLDFDHYYEKTRTDNSSESSS